MTIGDIYSLPTAVSSSACRRTDARLPCNARGANNHHAETIINHRAIAAAGILAGGLLLAPAFSPALAQERTPIGACDSNDRNRAACHHVKESVGDPERIAAAARKKSLAPHVQRECSTLRETIRDNEQVEQRRSESSLMEAVQQDTLSLRRRYRALGCQAP